MKIGPEELRAIATAHGLVVTKGGSNQAAVTLAYMYEKGKREALARADREIENLSNKLKWLEQQSGWLREIPDTLSNY